MISRKTIAFGLVGAAVTAAAAAGVASAATHSNTQLTAAQREARYEAKLDAAVSAGKLTAAQKTAVLTEHTKLEQELAAAPKSTKAERQAIHKQILSEAKAWAKANGVKARWLIAGRPHLRGGHTATPSPTSTPSAN